MEENNKKVTFDLGKLEVTDLEGNVHKMAIDKKEFGNVLYLIGSKTIEMDEIAKSIHKTGKATADIKDIESIIEIIEPMVSYTRRFKESVKNHIEKLKS